MLDVTFDINQNVMPKKTATEENPSHTPPCVAREEINTTTDRKQLSLSITPPPTGREETTKTTDTKQPSPSITPPPTVREETTKTTDTKQPSPSITPHPTVREETSKTTDTKQPSPSITPPRTAREETNKTTDGGVRPAKPSPSSASSSPTTSAKSRRLPVAVLNGLRRAGVDAVTSSELIAPPPAGANQGETETSRSHAAVVYRLDGGAAAGPSMVIDLSEAPRALFARYLEVDAVLRKNGVRTPLLLAVNRKAGQLLARHVEPDAPLMNGLKAHAADHYLATCLTVLDRMMQIPAASVSEPKPSDGCPRLDKQGLLNGMNLFVQWYLPLKKVQLSPTECAQLADMMSAIAAHIAARPYCFTHGNFRRAQLTPLRGGDGVVVSGFERAVGRGPVCYDLATLLTDRRLGLSRHRAQQAVVDLHRHPIRQRYDEQELCARQRQQLTDYTALQISLTRMGELARGLLMSGVGRQPSVLEPVGAELAWYKRQVAQLVGAWPQLQAYSDVFKQKFHAL